MVQSAVSKFLGAWKISKRKPNALRRAAIPQPRDRKMLGPNVTRWNSTSPSRARNRSRLFSKRACAFARRRWTKRQRSFALLQRNKADAFAVLLSVGIRMAEPRQMFR